MFGVENDGGSRTGSVSREEGGGDADLPPSSIMHAAYVGALELVKSMVETGSPADAPDVLRGSTPLHWASFGGHLDVVRWLVKTAGADAQAANTDGCTPLFFACERGHLGVAQWLVREAGAEVNVKDNVMWQTPLHRVCLNARSGNVVHPEVDDLILWLVESGADLTAVDRFGNHVEDLRNEHTEKTLTTAGSGSKLCDMISSAREEGVSAAETREKLKRRSAARRKGGSEVNVQMSPKLEAKQRAPVSRRGSRKGSGMAQSGSDSGGNSTLPPGSTAPELTASPLPSSRGSGGSGGGVAALAAGTGAKMGGGPPAPAVAGGEDLEDGEEPGAGMVGSQDISKSGKDRYSRRPSGGGNAKDDELQQQESLRVAEEALSKTYDREGIAKAGSSKLKFDGAGQRVVDQIRELAKEKKAGTISEEEFSEQKARLLEMEQLRREAEEEAQRRSEGLGADAGAGILTSVGQNTPPPSPKNAPKNDDESADEDDDNEPIQILPATAIKDARETYKASDIERYTSVNPEDEAPRVFGEVPESVKESLAAKETAKAAAVEAAKSKAQGAGKKPKGKKKSHSKNGSGGGGATGAASGAGAGSGGISNGTPAGGGDSGGGSPGDDLPAGAVNQSEGGCKCVVM